MDRREFVKVFGLASAAGILRKKMQYVPPAKIHKEVDVDYPIGVIYDGSDNDVVLGIVSANKLLEQGTEVHQNLKTDFIADIGMSLKDDGKYKSSDMFNKTVVASITIRKSEEILDCWEDHGLDISKAYMIMHPAQYRHLSFAIALEYQDIVACEWDMRADKILKLCGHRIPVIRTREMPKINGKQVRVIILTSKSIPFPEEKWHSIGDWMCKFCHNTMARHRVRCEVCGEYRSLVV